MNSTETCLTFFMSTSCCSTCELFMANLILHSVHMLGKDKRLIDLLPDQLHPQKPIPSGRLRKSSWKPNQFESLHAECSLLDL